MTANPLKTALVVGATGLIGHQLVTQLVNSSLYNKIRVLVRKSLNWQHPRLQEIIVDFDQPNGLLMQADDIFCCLGTTRKKAGSKEGFRKVDYQYPLDIARLGRANGASQFAIVTSMGANPNSSFFYNQVKGEIERDLALLDYPTLLIFRPSLLLGNRGDFRLGEKIGEGFMRLFGPILPTQYQAIDSSKVVNAMITTAQQPRPGVHVFESGQLQAF